MDPVATDRLEPTGVGDHELVVRETRTATDAAVSALRSTTRAWTRLCALEEDVAEDIVLAVDEAVSNAVEHAYPGQVGAVHLELTRCPGGELLTVVQDQGTWRPPPDAGFRGRGLLLMERLADTASVLHTGAGTTVWMRWTAGL